MYRLLMVIIAMWSVAATAGTSPDLEAGPGLVMKYETKDGGMLVSGDMDWGSYAQIQLEKATAEFRENWARDQLKLNSAYISEEDEQRLKTDMSGLLDTILGQKLSGLEGFNLSDASGAGVLRFSPKIAKLDIFAPGIGQNYIGNELVDSKGSMVLVLEISDSVSGELLASAWQLQLDPQSGFMDTATTANNRTAFRQMMVRWADWFLEMLDVVRNGGLD